jgi:hypothetical protein
MSREHVLAEWIAIALGLKGPGVIRMEGETVRTVTKEGSFDLVARRVCGDCNNGWMSDVESEMGTLMTSAIRNDHPVTLTRGAQAKVATWCTKTALMLEYALGFVDQRRLYTPLDNCRWLFERRRPPSNTKVWIGAFDAGGSTPWTHKAGPLRFPVDGVHRDAGYFSSFTIGALLVQVAGADLTGPYAADLVRQLRRVEPPPPFDNVLISIWPRRVAVVNWPGKHFIAGNAIEVVSAWPERLFPPPTAGNGGR